LGCLSILVLGLLLAGPAGAVEANDPRLNQTGDRNLADISQSADGSMNTANVGQVGNDNRATLVQNQARMAMRFPCLRAGLLAARGGGQRDKSRRPDTDERPGLGPRLAGPGVSGSLAKVNQRKNPVEAARPFLSVVSP